ncbi:substrate-binding periplasmic protein [Marinobacterium lutimaris]|uniref:Amino acid ABC transporter substrate-binding protein, PAAT family n=1 Tax=Marinobacterium lutimaris TaxID=568106 RepID=A0A1H6AW54_9GAMM|nr:transporter substrate-binding domain-containing protein [Marinobacterium lutimaris]SEG52829.1 amino acid ABC transporter substrate-binding protein, PAAT family [Marinobacterium lutimaris]
MIKKSRLPSRLIVAFALGTLITEVSAAPLVVATEGVYPPFSYVDDSGQLSGFDTDIARALCREMERECELRQVAWSELIPEMEAGRVDFTVASMAKTDERARRVDFTDYYYRSHSTFAGDPSRFSDVSPQALAGFRLATGRDTIQAEFLQNHYPNSEIILTDDLPQTLELLKSGKADLALSDTINLLDFLQQPESIQFDYIGEPLQAEELHSKAHIAVRKGEDKLLRDLNEALEDIRLDGSYERINRKYFPFSIY